MNWLPNSGILYSFKRTEFMNLTKSSVWAKYQDFVKLQSSLTVQSKPVGLGVDFVFPPSQVTNN